MAEAKDRLLRLRKEKELKQDAIAELLQCSRSTISGYENGLQIPVDALAKLASFYDVSMDYLLGISNERKPAGGSLAIAMNTLSQLAGESAITATDITLLVETAIKYYRKGASCGDLPLLALRGFMDGLCTAMTAAASGDSAALIDGANAAAVAALEVTKMPAALYESLKESTKA